MKRGDEASCAYCGEDAFLPCHRCGGCSTCCPCEEGSEDESDDGGAESMQWDCSEPSPVRPDALDQQPFVAHDPPELRLLRRVQRDRNAPLTQPVCPVCQEPWGVATPCCTMRGATYCVECCTRELHGIGREDDDE